MRTEVKVLVPTELKSISKRTQGLLQQTVDIVGEEELPKLLEYVESNPEQYEGMLRMLLNSI